MATLLVALATGALIGASLGALGGGGSILTVPVLVYLLHESPAAATTGSLVVVGVTAAIAAVTAYRQGRVLVGRGIAFGAMTIAGAVAGAAAAAHVDGDVLMLSFALLMFAVGAVMFARTRRGPSERDGGARPLDDPIIGLWPVFTCACPRAAKLLVTATMVGGLTGFLGVGGGFIIVPVLLLVLAVPLDRAIGTSLVIIAMTSAVALVVRSGAAPSPDWVVVGVLTIAASIGAVLGARIALRLDITRLTSAFTALVFVVAVFTAAQSAAALL